MSELVRIIDDYRDRHGQPSEASVARAIGVSPQALNSWRRRGVRELPAPQTLRKLAEFVRVPYATVLEAAAIDAGYLQPEERGGDDRTAAPMKQENDRRAEGA